MTSEYISEFIESEKFESDFYFEYLSMLNYYEQKKDLEELFRDVEICDQEKNGL
jgi:hypothetical protein